MTCRSWVLLVCLDGLAASPQNYTHPHPKVEKTQVKVESRQRQQNLPAPFFIQVLSSRADNIQRKKHTSHMGIMAANVGPGWVPWLYRRYLYSSTRVPARTPARRSTSNKRTAPTKLWLWLYTENGRLLREAVILIPASGGVSGGGEILPARASNNKR